ncbi:hypothetical protein BDF21DRAFT_417348 [Thamnidium elegans]|uniref:Kelch motif family protein n=1 Tax=Thamnidium elegans TaxID=101142 RepID=A0A8H7VR60_9FUNG|nr:hypothetical protein INT48_005164 [Thamnidium elegans]KAI8082202.1 hypothetical protein BDF21DRAFT_417348 [Thamnidium elegans]
MIRLLTLSLFASVCLGELIPVSKYIGQHKYRCDDYGVPLTGALVQDKIYTFGGCYPIPYIVDPNVENMYFIGSNDHNNVSETIQIYDIKKDEWTHETEVKLPYPWRSASTQTYQQDIYFYNVRSSQNYGRSSKMWKYDTVSKEFSALEDFPFNWHGSLQACTNNGRMYFVGSNDGEQRNIIQIYNIENGAWEKPLFPNLRFSTKQLLCSEDAIHFLGIVVADEDVDYSFDSRHKELAVIRSDYITGDTVLSGFSVDIPRRYGSVIKTNNDKFYCFNVNDEESNIFIVDAVALENRTLEALPHALAAPLFVPYQDDLIYLFGGGKRRQYFGNRQKPKGTLKTYSHKLVLESAAKFVHQKNE